MLAAYFKHPFTLRKFRSGPAGSYLHANDRGVSARRSDRQARGDRGHHSTGAKTGAIHSTRQTD